MWGILEKIFRAFAFMGEGSPGLTAVVPPPNVCPRCWRPLEEARRDDTLVQMCDHPFHNE